MMLYQRAEIKMTQDAAIKNGESSFEVYKFSKCFKTLRFGVQFFFYKFHLHEIRSFNFRPSSFLEV